MRATELEFLKWFYQNATFGPAEEDVRFLLKEMFKRKTKKELPDGYDEEYR